MSVCPFDHLNIFGQMNLSQNLSSVSINSSSVVLACRKNILLSMFDHSLYSHYNSRKSHLSKNLPIAKNGFFFKSVFNRKYVKFSMNIISKSFLYILPHLI